MLDKRNINTHIFMFHGKEIPKLQFAEGLGRKSKKGNSRKKGVRIHKCKRVCKRWNKKIIGRD